MTKLFGWSAKRAGGMITIAHGSGKVANIDRIEPRDGKVVAFHRDGAQYELMQGLTPRTLAAMSEFREAGRPQACDTELKTRRFDAEWKNKQSANDRNSV